MNSGLLTRKPVISGAMHVCLRVRRESLIFHTIFLFVLLVRINLEIRRLLSNDLSEFILNLRRYVLRVIGCHEIIILFVRPTLG